MSCGQKWAAEQEEDKQHQKLSNARKQAEHALETLSDDARAYLAKKIKLEQAAIHIRTKMRSLIKEVAADLGYTSSYYLEEAFKECHVKIPEIR